MKCADMHGDFVLLKNIAYCENKLKMGVWHCHHNGFDSMKMWDLEHQNDVFICCKIYDIIDLSFILGIQTSWQKKMMLKHGHNRAIAMDATFGTNVSKYPLFSMLVFVDWKNDIHVALNLIS